MGMAMLREGVLGFALLFFGLGVAAQAGVQVSFKQPERYADAQLHRASDGSALQPTLHGIESHLKALGERYLPPDHVLKVEILDIDLAGRFEPWRPFASDVRVMREVTWPRITLRYALESDGRVVNGGEETIRDLDYLQHNYGTRSYDELRYEKAMLDEWFLTRLGKIVLPDGAPFVSFPAGN